MKKINLATNRMWNNEYVVWRLKSLSGNGLGFDALLAIFGGNGAKSNGVKKKDLVRAMEYLLNCEAQGGRSSTRDFYAFLSEFQKASRNFAKPQLTWFRNEPIYNWIDALMLH
ncbi:tRNA dimethylallyltransferase 9 [Tanacetum coccineum]